MTNVTKAEVARDVWQQLVGYFFAHRESHAHAAQELGLTPGHMKTLFELDGEEGRSMGDLAVVLVCDASNVTWLVDRLEEHGLAERRAHPGDRRIRTVALTRKGAKVRSQVEARIYEAPDSLRALSPNDLQALARILRKIAVPAHPRS